MCNFDSFAKLFLADWLIDHFDVVRFEDHPSDGRIDIWLDEKKVVPDFLFPSEVTANGFTAESEVQDFPVRGKAVFLHLRRRKWHHTQTCKVYSQSFDMAHKGTRLTKELVAFLKATN